MAQQNVNIGLAPNDLLGDPLRVAFAKINANFDEIYPLLPTVDQKAALVGPASHLPTAANPYVTLSYLTDYATRQYVDSVAPSASEKSALAGPTNHAPSALNVFATVSYITSIIHPPAGSDHEVQKKSGSGFGATGLFSYTQGNITLGAPNQTGDRRILTTDGSEAQVRLILKSKGTLGVTVEGGALSIINHGSQLGSDYLQIQTGNSVNHPLITVQKTSHNWGTFLISASHGSTSFPTGDHMWIRAGTGINSARGGDLILQSGSGGTSGNVAIDSFDGDILFVSKGSLNSEGLAIGTIAAGTNTMLAARKSADALKTIIFENLNSGASAGVLQEFITAGGNDLFTRYRIGVENIWSVGVDNSDNDSYKISNSGGVGSADRVIVTKLGNFGLSVSPEARLHVNGSVRFDIGNDAAGDVYYRGPQHTLVRLPIGGLDQILTIGPNNTLIWKTFSIGDGDKGDISVTSNGVSWTINPKRVTYAKIQDVTPNRVLGRITGTVGSVEELTGSQVTGLLSTFTPSAKGVVPASGGGTTNFLRADGQWAPPPAGGGGDAESGTYTPVALNTVNVQSYTFREAMWIRVGNVVHVSGQVLIDRSTSGSMFIRFSLPIASDLQNEYDVAGAAGEAAGQVARTHHVIISAYPSLNAVELEVADSNNFTGQAFFSFTFSYKIVADQGGDPGDGEAAPEISIAGTTITATYVPLSDELNKPPTIEDVTIATNGQWQEGATLTATIVGSVNAPFSPGTHQFQWYRLSAEKGATLSPITGATNSTYVLQLADVGSYIVCAARYAQSGGTNQFSDWFYSEMTSQITASGGGGGNDGDINHAWEDFFDIESGASIPANWNDAGVSPELINLGSNANWTTVEASKPLFSVDKLVFSGAHRVTGVSESWPPVFEMWIKFRATGDGFIVAHGQQNLLAVGGGNFAVKGMPDQPGDQNEHVARIVFNGSDSKFQIDNGPVITFTETTTSATFLNFGMTHNGINPGNFELKRFQRTATGVFLSTQEVADKWAFHGF